MTHEQINAWGTIWNKLNYSECLCQLAEEADELGHAALKLRRALTKTNPTPVSVADAEKNLLEELVDVRVAIDACGLNTQSRDAQEIYDAKVSRWAKRLGDDTDGAEKAD